MKKRIPLFILGVLLAFGIACGALVDDQVPYKVAKVNGLTDVVVKAKHILFVGCYGCSSRGDSVVFEITAKNAQGEYVEAIVCAGWPFKGGTLRTTS